MFCLRIVLLLFLVSGTLTQDDFGLSLEDALDSDPTPKPSKPDKPAVVPPKSGGDGFGFDLGDALGPDPTPKPKPDKPAVKPGGDDVGLDLGDALGPDPTPKPKPDKPAVKPGTGGGVFDDSALSDAADEINPGGRPDDPPPYNPNSGHGGDQPQDPDLLWGQILKMLNANMPEEFFMWMSNLKQIITPLLERVLDLLQAIP